MAYDDKENVLNDICIGRGELKRFYFDYECDITRELCYELYCVPSHNKQAYYVQVFKKTDGYYMSYAKSIIEDSVQGKTIYMYTLKNAVEVNDKPRYNGKIVCGFIRIENSFADYLGDLFAYLQEGSHWNEDSFIVVDGTFQMIRVYADGKILKEAAFHNELASVGDEGIRKSFARLNQLIEHEIATR